ncbi:methyltransferase domain-containing protein [Dermatophilaceae bacterium Sec6.4]
MPGFVPDRNVRAVTAMSVSCTAMDAEFDTLATWTAQVAADLTPADRIPAGCRGSGNPGAMHWLLDHLQPQPGQTFLDAGAGIGGPAAFAAAETGVRPLLTEPQPGACRAARSLFDLPALRANSRLPIATGAIAGGWSLGVLSTMQDQPQFLAEIRRVLRPQARFGLIVYCAAHPGPLRQPPPEGNNFPTERALGALLEHASLRVLTSGWIEHFAALPAGWADATHTVQAELEHRHRNDPRWQRAEEQSSRMGALLTTGEVRGQLLVVQPA